MFQQPEQKLSSESSESLVSVKWCHQSKVVVSWINDWPWKAGLLTWNRLPSTSVNHYCCHTNDSFTTLTLQMNQTEQPYLLMDGDRPITTDIHHLSLTANNITAKPNNQFIQTGLRTFDWQQIFTWLWW